jgi:hypothetical protein
MLTLDDEVGLMRKQVAGICPLRRLLPLSARYMLMTSRITHMSRWHWACPANFAAV